MEQKRDVLESVTGHLPSRDETAALEAAGGDADLARELVETLLKGLPNELSELQGCFFAQDWPAVAATAHRMRGATSYCGATALNTCLQGLERVAATGDPARIEFGLRQVEREAKRLTRSVNR